LFIGKFELVTNLPGCS